MGPLWVLGCNQGSDFGTPQSPVCYDLAPSFFAGDPIDDLSSGTNMNRLVIRMQRTGQATEFNDVLFFQVDNSYEVARCVRGATVNGVPDIEPTDRSLGPWCDFNQGTATDAGAPDAGAVPDAGVVADAGAVDGGTTSPCPPTTTPIQPMPGYSIIDLSSQGYMQASLQLLATCQLNVFTASGTAVAGHTFPSPVGGWIQFIDFGSASVDPTIPSDQRSPVPVDFKVNYGERLRAQFHIVLQDDRVLTAQQTQPGGPIPMPLMGATLDGTFDFNMVRGRAAQPFP
jgi:hypothetical protein